MLTIDGSTLEGGGQLTRLSLSLASITRTKIRIHSIRAGRSANRNHSHSHRTSKTPTRFTPTTSKERGAAPAGGLKDSHLAALTFLATQTNARVEGASLGSTEITFRPSSSSSSLFPVGEREHEIHLSKPGSVWLIFQAIYPFLAFETDWSVTEHVALSLRGGTNVSKAMSTEYMLQVFCPVALRVGLPGLEIVESDGPKRGWAGNAPELGIVKVKICRPKNVLSGSKGTGKLVLRSFDICDRGSLVGVDVTVVADPVSTREVLINTLTSLVGVSFPGVQVNVHMSESSGDERRLYVLLVARTSNGWRLGKDYLGGGGRAKNVTELKRKFEEACISVVRGLEREVSKGGCVDEHMQDQLVGLQALAEGMSRVQGDGYGGGNQSIPTEDVDEDGNVVREDRVEVVGDQGGTLHTRTVRWVCETILGDKGLRFEEGGVCHGIGWNGGR